MDTSNVTAVLHPGTQEAIERYDKHAHAYQQALRHKRPVADLRRFAALCRRDELVLDAGCGPASDLRVLTDLGVRPVGVDLADGVLEEARMLLPRHPLVKAPLQALPFRPRAFGGLWLSGSLNHLPRSEWAPTMDAMMRLLDTGPVYFSCVRGRRDMEEVEDPILGRVRRSDATEDEVTAMLTSYGLKDLQVEVRPDPLLEKRRPWVVALGRRV